MAKDVKGIQLSQLAHPSPDGRQRIDDGTLAFVQAFVGLV